MPTFSAMPLHGIMFEISRFLDSNLSWPAGTRPAAISLLCRRGAAAIRAVLGSGESPMARRWSLTCSCVLASSPPAAAAVGGSGIPAGAERKTAHRKVAVNSNKARGKPGRPAVRSKPIRFTIPAFRQIRVNLCHNYGASLPIAARARIMSGPTRITSLNVGFFITPVDGEAGMSTGQRSRVGARKAGARLLVPMTVLFTVWLFPGAARAESDLPLFDAHVHYNREAWEVLPPEAGKRGR